MSSTAGELAQYQTDLVCQWLDNDEPSYNAYIDRLERRGLFNASTAKRFVYNLWGNRTPEGSGMSRVRWGQVAEFLNSSPIEEGWIAMRIDELKRRNKRAGYYFFSRATMDYFQSIAYPNTRTVKNEEGIAVGVLFVTSEKQPHDSAPRLYTLRFYHIAGDRVDQIDHLGEFQGFPTLERAILAMRRYTLGSEVKAECDPTVLNTPVQPISYVLENLPGIAIDDQLAAFLSELGL